MTCVAQSTKTLIAGLNAPVGRRILLTGGPTCEDIDAVRFISNRSTGRMGVEAALAAQDMGFVPLLVMGPGSELVPDDIACVRVRSAADMLESVLAAFQWCDYLVMTAAVADYTPCLLTEGKLKKTDGDLLLRLKRTADILRTLAEHPDRAQKKIAGFSLDAGMNLEEGRRKLVEKNLDLIAVNTVSAFGAQESSVTLLSRGAEVVEIHDADKRKTARTILEMLARSL